MSTNSSSPGAGNGTAGAAPPPDPSLMLYLPITERSAYLARVYIGVTSVLLVLCALTFFTRMYQRVRPVWKVGWDDYFIIVGFCLSVVDWAFLLQQQIPTAGLFLIDDYVARLRYGWIAIGIWGISMTCLKVSIALTLLRIQQKSLAWRIFLFSIIAVQTTYGILNIFFNLVIACKPLERAWDFRVTTGYCVSNEVMSAASNTGSGVNIATDILLSLAPAVFLRKLNRPLRERIFICVLMGLGLFASAWSIIKTVQVQKFYQPGLPPDEMLAVGNTVATYTVLEQLTGILAACIPAMKNIFQALLGKMGIVLTESRSRPGRSGYYLNDRSRTNPAGGALGSHAFRSAAHHSQLGSRIEKEGKIVDEDEEACVEMNDMRRGLSTPKSSRTASSTREVDYNGHGPVVSVHAV